METSCLDLKTLKNGTKLTVETQNSFYDITLDGDNAVIFGGLAEHGMVRFRNEEVYISGCTWGGSAIKCNHLVVDMRMEIWIKEECITTSRIKKITVDI